MNWGGCSPRFWVESAFGGGKPIFFDKTGFPPPNPHHSQKNDQRASRPLDSGKWVGSEGFEFLACVMGLDVRHDCASVPCLAHGIGLDVRHGCSSVPCVSRLLSVVEINIHKIGEER